ncbi:MAG: ABC transporter substrate-binding protein [Desulfarculaceae bacterium]|nr:ABC transporter substrate-binding protein [Desulfarculaceae bacterium]MCF8072281.1 ABC transporter substrate-binding protein [Desulfarculaceae bacterium]MCF8100202.1 ABC transporter substrate-binding protein [Desulfarculaceae bacterium]MCF8116225.1 ABC transporter substrate-binding protein [Desulfarculaceae bacterium]
MKRTVWMIALLAAACLVLAPMAMAKEIKVGGIFDQTGPTGAVGADYQKGAVAATKFWNDKGGINGDMLKLISNDYAYKIPEALNLYKKYKDVDRVFVIQGWGTGDTNALRPLVNRAKIVFFSASYDGNLTDPKKNPYNFFIGTSYSTAIRLAMIYAKEQGAKKVVFIYPDHPYGKNPIPAGKDYAKKLGLNIGPDEIVSLRAMDATSQLLHMKKFNPDFAWIGGTTPSTAVIIKDAAKHGINTKFMINCWGFDENLPRLAGKAAEGRAFGMLPVAPFGADVPGMKAVVDSAGGKKYTLHYVKSWVSVMVMVEGLKRAKKAGKLNGPGLKAALETLKDFNTGGLCAPITYTGSDHRPNTTMAIGGVKDGKIYLVKDVNFPRKKEYIGW